MSTENTRKCSGGNTKPPRHRSYCFTSFSGKIAFNPDKFKYLLQGEEICPDTGNSHIQGYLQLKNAQTFDYMKKHVFVNNEHFEVCKGSAQSNMDYCMKDGKYEEEGEPPKQGKRSDLEAVKSDIVGGVISVDDIIINNPMVYHQYGRTLNAIEERVMAQKFRKDMTIGVWLYGDTGTGKSHIALNNFSPETHYIYPNDNGWWDNYRQQNVVVLNDFRGEIPYNQLLQLIDKWPYEVKRRGRPPMPFLSKIVIITSSLCPDKVYHNRADEDKIAQLLRRCVVFNTNLEEELSLIHI